MKIGVATPFRPHDLADLLDTSSRGQLEGLGGMSATPVAPLVREWHRRGHDLAVFCLERSATRALVLRGERLSIHVIPKRRARSCLLDFYRTECRLLREAIRQETPEVISAQWTYDHAWAALQCGIPTVVTCHDAPLRIAWIVKHWFTLYHLVMAWRVVHKANRLICVSPYTAGHIQKYFRPKCPVDIVPNGLLPEVFQRGERRLQNADRPERPFTLCSVGSWGGLKNISTLLKAFVRVRSREPAVRLALFGRDLGPDQAAEQWARRHNLHDGVDFNGSTPHEKILNFLETEAGLMIHPSLIEANPMVLMEAMACGVPVIAGGNSGGVAWTLDEGRCGFLCDIRDERALEKTMMEALQQPDGNRALIERARFFVKQRFSLEAAVSSNEAILKQLCAENRKPLG
jgi:L-malate glycosyltransferase